MAFGTKYRITFRDRGDTAWYVDFKYDGYSGAVTSLIAGEVPVTIRRNTDDKYTSIVTSSADIELIYTSDVDSLFIENDQEVKVRIYNASGFGEWNGYLVPNQYFRLYSSRKQTVKFTATDQLRLLENMNFEDSSNDPYYYIDDDLASISKILRDKVASPESVRESINIYEDNHSSAASNSPLPQTYFYREMYWDNISDLRENCFTVLDDILKKYGARIFYSEYLWHLQRPNSMWAHRVVRLFTGDPLAYSLNYGAIEEKWNRVDEGAVWLPDTELEKYPRAGIVEVTSNPGRKDNLVMNPTFDDFTHNGSSYPYYWDDNADVSISDGYITINDVDGVGDPTQSMYADFKVKNIAGGNIVLEIEPTYSGGTTCILHFGLSSVSEIRWCQLQGYAGDYPDWQNSESHYELDVHAEGLNGVRFILTIPVYPDPLNPEADYRLHLFEVEDNNDTTASYKVYDVRFKPYYAGIVPERQRVGRINSSTSFNKITRDLRQCDSIYPDTNGGDGQFWALRYSTDGDHTTSEWYIKGDPETETTGIQIQELLAKQIIEGYDAPTTIIRGTLRYNLDAGNYYPYSCALVENTMVDNYGFAKCFMPLDVDWDVRNMLCRGRWIEVSPLYEDLDVEWASETYATAGITGNEIDMNETVSGTMTATSDAFTVIARENVRVKAVVVDGGNSDPPNYSIDGQTGTLAFGTNYLQFAMSSAGSKTFSINHTNGEKANCVITIYIYRLTGL